MAFREHLDRASARPWLCALALAAVYFVLSRVALFSIDDATGAATLWPASGVALAAFIVAPRRYWPWLAAGVFVGNLAAQLSTREALATSAALAAVDALEPVVVGYTVSRIAGASRRDITQLRTVAAITVAAFVTSAAVAVLGALVLQVAFGGSFVTAWEGWWLADGVGMLVIAPLLLALVRPAPGRASRLETIALLWLTAWLAAVIFVVPQPDTPTLLSFAFPLMPMLTWCALRLGTRSLTLALLAVAAITAVATTQGAGPFGSDAFDALAQAQAVQGFIALAVVSTLLVGAVVAGQRRAERHASDEAERLASVLRASDAAIIAIDIGGAITHWSEGAERMLGYSAQEMLGRHGAGIHDPAELEARAAELGLNPNFELFVHAALLAERRDWTWITADGRRLTVALSMSVQRDHEGRMIGFLAMGSDVTVRREATRLLAASEERHRLVLNNLPDAQVYLYDRDLVCVMGEGQAIPQDVPESEYVGRRLTDLLAAGNLRHLQPRFEAALAGTPTHTTFVSPRTARHHEMHLVPVSDANGAPDGVLVVMRDITERRAQEQAVRRAEADLRTIFDEAPIGNAVFDAGLRLVEANAALVAITGYQVDELREAPIDATLEPDDAARLIDLMARVSRGQQRDGETEVAFRHADGRSVELSLHVVGLGVDGDGDGSRRRTLVQVVDVSERKRFEDRLRHQADHDSLTGLLNRRRFEAELGAHMDRARRYGAQGAVVLVDVDGFKQVNDTQGHAAGDELIVTVARILESRVRSSDALARLGGDEFVILLPAGHNPGFETVAQSLVDAVRAQTDVSISVGVAPLAHASALTADQILRDADGAMYAAKAAGRDRYAVFTTDPAGSAARPSTPTS